MARSWALSVLFLISFFISENASAQFFIIEDGATVNTCSGAFKDDGDDPNTGVGNPYEPGQSYVYTICPDTPGQVVKVEFAAFQLFTSPNPNNSDYLTIYDGDNTGATSLGSYTGGQLQGLPVTASINNPSGCLTFAFSSNPNGGGTAAGWEALISCTTPCANPTAQNEIVNPEPPAGTNSIGVCLGEPITFADAGSTAGSGFNLEHWVWNFDDGNIDTLDGPGEITHAFEEPGEYLVTLSVIDNNGCQSLNLDPLQILVSTIPVFNTEFNSPICLGSSGAATTISGDPVQSVTWTALPPQVVAGEVYLPDGAGFSYTSSLVFDFFEPNSTLEECDDLLNVMANLEHSFIGDLSIAIECPDGTNVTLLEHPNGGGGTYFGEAVDVDSDIAGTGYDYGWSSSSTNGFVTDNANWTMTSYVDNAGNAENNNIVNPGIYESYGDMCDLVGCPLNGEWTFIITDNYAIDNGYIFSWGINFDPSLFPDVTTFTPIIGMGPDSTYWEGPYISSTSSNGNIINVSPPETGFYDYTFYATNNFGCTFDTTIVVEVIEGPEIDAGPDLFLCNDSLELSPGLAGVQGNCGLISGVHTYCYENGNDLVVTYCPDTPGDGTMMQFYILSGTVENNWDEFYVFDGENPSAPLIAGPIYDLTDLSFVATNPTGCITFVIDPDFSNSCASGQQDPLEVYVSCNGGGGMTWNWSPATGLSNPNIQFPSVFVEQPTVYTVTAYPHGMPGCAKTDQITVAPVPEANPGMDTDTTFCYNSPAGILTDYLMGNPMLGGTWTYTETGEPFGSTQLQPMDYPDGASFDLTYTVSNGECTNSSNLTITILGMEVQTCCQTNANPGPDAIACALEYQLQAEPVVGVGTWSGPPNVTFSDIHDPHAIVTAESPGGQITLTWTDNNGFMCSMSQDIVVTFADSLQVDAVTEDAICYDECNGKAIAMVTGGTSATGLYSFEWSGGASSGILQVRDSLCAGVHQLKVTDNVGCTDSTFFTISEPDPQVMTVTHTPPSCADSCDARIVVDASEAVSYSFNNGKSWTTENIGYVCAGPDTVIIKDAVGCRLRQAINISNPPRFIADFNINPNPTTIENTLVTFQDVSQPGPIRYSRYDIYADYKIATVYDRISQFDFPRDTSGTYEVRLISESENGCIDTVYKEVIVNDELLWFIPNSFTPNGDGMNEIWKPVGVTYDPEKYDLRIFDRWGREVFHTTDINEGWRGNVQGSDYFVPMGVYTYFIQFSSSTSKKKKQIKGFVTLIR